MAGKKLTRWLARAPRPAPEPDLHGGDPRFDGWEVARMFEDLATARAWRDHLREAGIHAVLASDWPLDRFGRGDIALQVPPERWSDAEELLEGLTGLD